MLNKKDLGLTVMTSGIASAMKEDDAFAQEVHKSFGRYINKDWGDMCSEDKQINDRAYRLGYLRIVGAYITTKGKIYIITEADRSVTTILFADEY